MKKELREKRKKLDEDYFSCFVEVIKYIRTLNLSKYAFYSLRDLWRTNEWRSTRKDF